ncbi:putative protein YnbB [Sesamum angolense]|uniref:Aluminum resistance protein n=1 Tax=Sesamum angolense TaxID=2727404 RepID=A0AAE1WRP1_9LAMI|nr:putative protein YnbB [Sesamum angolense]
MFLVLSSTTSVYPPRTFTLPCAATAYTGAKISARRKSRASAVSLHCEEQTFVPEVEKAVDSLYPEFRAVDNLVARNSARVLKAFQNARVGSHHFGGSTGYGHEEAGGREALDQAFAEIFGAESAIVRAQFFSGTHAITCALFAFLRPGDELLAVAGAPYDTLEEVIGIRDSDNLGSLKDFGIDYREVPLSADGGLDWAALRVALRPQTKCALIQRSCGYSWRRGLSVDEIGRAIKIIKGADLIAGSFIKNPGGTIAPCGGYVAGRKKWVAAAAARLSAPGLGVDCGSTPGDIMRIFFQGLFLAPQMVGEAIKGSLLIAEVMAGRGYKVQPGCRVPRHDVVQAVQLGSRERLLAFCEAVQRSSPVSSFTKPIAGATPGYASEVIFADGTFIDGSTSELSCDGPLREPFAVYCQGGSHWTQWGLVLGEGVSPLGDCKVASIWLRFFISCAILQTTSVTSYELHAPNVSGNCHRKRMTLTGSRAIQDQIF